MDKKKGNQTKNALLKAARTLFSQHGYEKTSVDTIVQRAGVAKGTAFYHFKSKEAVFHALMAQEQDVFNTFLSKTVASISSQANYVEQIHQLVEQLFSYFSQKKSTTNLFFREVLYFPPAIQEAPQLLWIATSIPLLESGKAAGAFSPSCSPELVSRLIWITCPLAAQEKPHDTALRTQLITLLLQGIMTLPSSSSHSVPTHHSQPQVPIHQVSLPTSPQEELDNKPSPEIPPLPPEELIPKPSPEIPPLPPEELIPKPSPETPPPPPEEPLPKPSPETPPPSPEEPIPKPSPETPPPAPEEPIPKPSPETPPPAPEEPIPKPSPETPPTPSEELKPKPFSQTPSTPQKNKPPTHKKKSSYQETLF